jgi:hypothetical protein
MSEEKVQHKKMLIKISNLPDRTPLAQTMTHAPTTTRLNQGNLFIMPKYLAMMKRNKGMGLAKQPTRRWTYYN